MPKIHTSFQALVAKEDKNDMFVYHCKYCGEYAFISNFHLDDMPRRKTDHSFIINEDAYSVNNNFGSENSVLIKRVSGYERQNRQYCACCKLLLAYHQGANYLYIVEDAVILEN